MQRADLLLSSEQPLVLGVEGVLLPPGKSVLVY